ncbi:hypothetical protein SADUNF_Sadunf16G0181100 [Salix dunnii]|uniref:Uncharacterized protein n=1 Tax=Salix dunnii TaxID=1413687 RepID=A0A835MGU8_9ROSI|nr:hypothetical protein SADUNF_Sadunf16G0181100 [Salix dunnii]
MTKERANFEALALREDGQLCPENVPEVYHFDQHTSDYMTKTLNYISLLYCTATEHKRDGKCLLCLSFVLICYLSYSISNWCIANGDLGEMFLMFALYMLYAVAEFCGNVELSRLTEQAMIEVSIAVSGKVIALCIPIYGIMVNLKMSPITRCMSAPVIVVIALCFIVVSSSLIELCCERRAVWIEGALVLLLHHRWASVVSCAFHVE